jgi:hypothetical protein
MEQVPKIVRERLKAAPPVTHPEADTLTAFSEKTLSERERVHVLEHLAHCRDCREVLALSLPDTHAVTPVSRPSPKSWFAWPALRWGFAAVGVALVASIGIMQYRKQDKSTIMAYQTPVPQVVEQQPSQPQAKQEAPHKSGTPDPRADAAQYPENRPAQVSKARQPETETVDNEPPIRRDEAAPATHGYSTLVPNAGALPHGPKVANQMQWKANQQQNSIAYEAVPDAPPAALAKQKATTDLSANFRAPSQLQTAEVASGAPPPGGQADSISGGVIQNQPLNERSINGGQGDAELNPAKPSAAYTTSTKIVGRETASLGGPLRVPNARWTINASGTLQRSLDQGATWQDINVTDGSSLSAGSMMVAVSKRPKELEDKDVENKKIERSKSASIVFRAVSANGPDVWAGGSEGVLYHSIDSGIHWTRVIPSAAGATLTGEVLSVSFPDSQHGKVSTSTSELWSTADGGQTWKKQ